MKAINKIRKYHVDLINILSHVNDVMEKINLTPEESLLLISKTIEETKQRFKEIPLISKA